jgi:hypothetical protein
MSPEEKAPKQMDSDSQPEFESPASQPDHSDGAEMEKPSDSENSDIPEASVVEASLASNPLENTSTPVVEAELVGATGGAIPSQTASHPLVQHAAADTFSPPPISANLDNVSAIGGAVSALGLGVWAMIGAFITNWSIINAVIGLLLGFWGLTSYRRRMAWIGIVLCLISMFLSLIQVSEIVNTYMNPLDENPL